MLATLAKSISGMGTYVDGRRSLIQHIKNKTRRLTRIKKPEIRNCDILILTDCILIICETQGRSSRFGKDKGLFALKYKLFIYINPCLQKSNTV